MLKKLDFTDALRALKLHPDCVDTEELANKFIELEKSVSSRIDSLFGGK